MNLGKGEIQHSFLVIPSCPSPLLGRELLTKLRAQINFETTGPEVSFRNPLVHPIKETGVVTTLKVSLEDEYKLYQYSLQKEPFSEVKQWLTDFPNSWLKQ